MSLLDEGLKGSQRPRLENYPLYATSAGDDAIDLAAVAGIDLDEWQQYVLRNSLGEKANGKWTAFEVALIVPRQNGKNIILEARELAGLFLFGERRIVHTAHEFRAVSEAFNNMRNRLRDCPELMQYVEGYETGMPERRIPGIKTAHGFESITLNNGNTIKYMTRTEKAGLGSGCDLLVYDEAFAVTEEQLAATMPTLSARTLTANPQIWFTSSAGRLSSTVLERVRNRGIDGSDKRLAFFEWSASEDALIDDEQAWAQANPALGVRIDVEYVRHEREDMDTEKFLRERMGLWASEQEDPPVIPAENWAACLDPQSRVGPRCVFALDVKPNREMSTIAVASMRADGKVHVEVVERDHGTAWVARRMSELVAKFPGARLVVDAGSAAGALQPELKRARIPLMLVGMREYAQACGVFFDAVMQGDVRHIGQEPLDEAIEAARVKPMGESLWKWQRKHLISDISPLVACSLAYLGADRYGRVVPEETRKRIVII